MGTHTAVFPLTKVSCRVLSSTKMMCVAVKNIVPLTCKKKTTGTGKEKDKKEMETRGCFISKKRQNTGVVHCRWRFACMATGITYCRVASDIPWTVKSCARCTRWTFARGEGKRRLPYLVGFRTDQSHAIHLGRLDKVERVHRLPSRIGLIARRRGTTKAGTPQYTYSNA